MNYIQELNKFEQFVESNYLSATAQLLWYKLMQRCNRSGWMEWIQIGNLRLMVDLHVGEKTLIKARKELEEAGLIEVTKGKKGCPNKYKLIPIKNTVKNTVQSESEAENPVQNTVNNTVQVEGESRNTVENTVKNTAIYKQKNNKKKNISKDMFKEKHTLPTKQEVQKYCEEIGKKMNIERFFDFYESKGWLIGKTKMVDWRASVRKWEDPKKPKENKNRFLNFQQRDIDYNALVADYYGFSW